MPKSLINDIFETFKPKQLNKELEIDACNTSQ